MRTLLMLGSLALAGCVDHYNIVISQLVIDDDSDDFGTPEIEVYLFDDDNNLLGCAGTRQGLGGVDEAGVLYKPEARLVDDDQQYDLAIGDGAVRFEVWEDDDDPVCPVYPDPNKNDRLGVSPSMSMSRWLAVESPLQFGSVSVFGLRFE